MSRDAIFFFVDSIKKLGINTRDSTAPHLAREIPV